MHDISLHGCIQPDLGGGECAHRPMVMVWGATVDQVHNNLELRTAVFCRMGQTLFPEEFRGIIVVVVTGYCLSKLRNGFDEIGTPFFQGYGGYPHQ